jgi:hypothetical protein
LRRIVKAVASAGTRPAVSGVKVASSEAVRQRNATKPKYRRSELEVSLNIPVSDAYLVPV